MKKMLEINDLKILAKKKLPKMFYDYVDSGSYTESTYKENETDFNKIKLRQRVGRDISTSKLSKKFLKRNINYHLALLHVAWEECYTQMVKY